MATVELEYICDYCGGPIEDRKGCLEVFFSDIHSYRHAQQEWQQVHGDGPHTISQLLQLPSHVPWRLHHYTCNPHRVDGYDIDVAKVRTWRDLVRWTAHLLEKNWLALTDWHQVIRAAAERRSGRIKELTKGDAA